MRDGHFLRGSGTGDYGRTPELKHIADSVYPSIGKQNDATAMAIVTAEGVVLVDTGNNHTDSRALLGRYRASLLDGGHGLL